MRGSPLCGWSQSSIPGGRKRGMWEFWVFGGWPSISLPLLNDPCPPFALRLDSLGLLAIASEPYHCSRSLSYSETLRFGRFHLSVSFQTANHAYSFGKRNAAPSILQRFLGIRHLSLLCPSLWSILRQYHPMCPRLNLRKLLEPPSTRCQARPLLVHVSRPSLVQKRIKYLNTVVSNPTTTTMTLNNVLQP